MAEIVELTTKKKLINFTAIGIFNTLFNIVIFDTLVFMTRVPDLWANFVSLIISILISYFLNKFFVFRDDKRARGEQLLEFMAGTFAIQLVFQHLAVWLLGERYTIVGKVAYSILMEIHIHIDKTLVILTVAKCLGVAVSIAISYLFYDKHVFRTNED